MPIVSVLRYPRQFNSCHYASRLHIPGGEKHALNCGDTSGAVLILCPSISMAPNPGVQSPRVTLESPWLRQQSPH